MLMKKGNKMKLRGLYLILFICLVGLAHARESSVECYSESALTPINQDEVGVSIIANGIPRLVPEPVPNDCVETQVFPEISSEKIFFRGERIYENAFDPPKKVLFSPSGLVGILTQRGRFLFLNSSSRKGALEFYANSFNALTDVLMTRNGAWIGKTKDSYLVLGQSRGGKSSKVEFIAKRVRLWIAGGAPEKLYVVFEDGKIIDEAGRVISEATLDLPDQLKISETGILFWKTSGGKIFSSESGLIYPYANFLTPSDPVLSFKVAGKFVAYRTNLGAIGRNNEILFTDNSSGVYNYNIESSGRITIWSSSGSVLTKL
jgi:hypothetical protein